MIDTNFDFRQNATQVGALQKIWQESIAKGHKKTKPLPGRPRRMAAAGKRD